MLQHKALTSEQNDALLVFSLWAKTGNVERLKDVKKHFGGSLFRVLAEASLHDHIEKWENTLKIPARSGKALLPLVADLFAHYIKDVDQRVY